MEIVKRITVCGTCGGPRSVFSGRVCKACYSSPIVRRTYLTGRAVSPLPFDTERFETIIVDPKPRKPPVRKPRIYWEGNAVPVDHYVKPHYQNAFEALARLQAPENIWRDDGSAPKFRAPRIRKPVELSIALAYPFVSKPRDEHADLLAVNSLVPRGLPGREDICQEVMLALWEKKITLDQLKANRGDLRAFVRAFTKDNYEAGGYAISLDVPMHSGKSWHDVLAAPEF